MSRAAAENVTGEATVAPLPGAQILTVLSVVAVQVCAVAPFAKRNNEKNADVANESERSEITQTPEQRGCQEPPRLPGQEQNGLQI